jgi:hypothetical protein
MPTRQLLEVVGWNDYDATAHVPLRTRITNSNLTQLHLT